ncbi:MAG: methylated-DNA--[protein]-cysteine S-methyltransferase [Candidatus Zixiibacteriota bacterium]
MKTMTPVYYGHFRAAAFGDVWYAVSKRGLWRVDFGRTRERFLKDLTADGVDAIADDRQTAKIGRAFKEYFAGRRQRFDLPIDWSRVDGFSRKALQACARIPYGKTVSYGELAERAGSPGGARAAGQAMSRNPFPIVVPCHRVVRSDGSIGGFSGQVHHKIALLELEGAREAI